MSDLAKWKVHGPVHTLRIELAEWDLSKEEWQAPRSFTLFQFLPNGRISESESHNQDGSISRSSHSYDGVGRINEVRFRMNGGPISKAIYSYDDSGRLIRVVSVDQDGTERESEAYNYSQDGKRTKLYFVPKLKPNVGFAYAIEGTEQSYSAPGATTIATVYDEGGRPDEILFYDAEHCLLRSIILKRDTAGRLVREEVNLGGQMPFPEMQPELENMRPKAREAAAMFGNLLGPNNVTTYAYDQKGRLLERFTRMGDLSEHRTTFRYDDHDNKIEESIDDISREMQIDEEGNIQPAKERFDKQNLRFEYRYDAQWNWTECVVWSRLEPNSDFQRSNVQRREISYYAG